MAYTRHPDELSPYYRNPRLSDLDTLCESLLVHGQYRPLVVNLGSRTGRRLEVLAGNHVLAAMRMLAASAPTDPRWAHLADGRRYEPGDEYWEQVAVHEIDVDDDQAARIVAIDNRSSDDGTYDTAVLAQVLADLPDLDGTGYTTDELDDMLADLAARAVPPDDDDEPAGTRGMSAGPVITDAVQEYVLAQKPLEQKLQGYVASDSRSVILAYSGEAYVAVVEGLAELGRRYGTPTNSETVRRLITTALVAA